MAAIEPRATRSRVRQMGGNEALLTPGKSISTTVSATPARRPRATPSRAARLRADSTLLDVGDGLPQSQPEEDPLREALRRSASGRPDGTPTATTSNARGTPSVPAVASPARRSRRVQAMSSLQKTPEEQEEESPLDDAKTRAQPRRTMTSRRAAGRSDDGASAALSQPNSTLAPRGTRTSATASAASSSEASSRPQSSKRQEADEQQASAADKPAALRSSEERLAELRLRMRKAAGEAPQDLASTSQPLARAQSQGGLSARERLQQRRRRREEEQRLQRGTTQHDENEDDAPAHSKPFSVTTSGLSRRHSTYERRSTSPSEHQARTNEEVSAVAKTSSSTAAKRKSMLPSSASVSSPGTQVASMTKDKDNFGDEPEPRASSSFFFSEQRRSFEGGPMKVTDAMTADWIADQRDSTRKVYTTDSTVASRREPFAGSRAVGNGQQGRADVDKNDDDTPYGPSSIADLGLSKATTHALASLEASLARLGAGRPLASSSKARKRYSLGAAARRRSSDAPDDEGRAEGGADLSTFRDCAQRAGARVVESSNIDAQRSSSPRMPAALRQSATMTLFHESSAERRNKVDANMAGSARLHHQRRLLGSERGADEAGNSPRKQPLLDLSSTYTSSTSSSSQPRAPSFLERARAARAKTGQTGAIEEQATQSKTPETPSAIREPPAPFASAGVTPALATRRRALIRGGSSETAFTSDDEDEARVERELTPMSESDSPSAVSSPSGMVRAQSMEVVSQAGPSSSPSSPGRSAAARRARRQSLYPGPLMSAASSPSGRYPHQNGSVASSSASTLANGEFVQSAHTAVTQVAKSLSLHWRGLGMLTPAQSFILEHVERLSRSPTDVRASLFDKCHEAARYPLTGAVVLVDIRHQDGTDASDKWIRILAKLGAKPTRRIPSPDTHIHFTHAVWKNGRPTTLNWYKRLSVHRRPVMVGPAWIEACLAGRGWAKEEDYLSEYGRDSLVQLRRYLEEINQAATAQTAPQDITPQGEQSTAPAPLAAPELVHPVMLPSSYKWLLPVRFACGYEMSRYAPLNVSVRNSVMRWGIFFADVLTEYVDGQVFRFQWDDLESGTVPMPVVGDAAEMTDEQIATLEANLLLLLRQRRRQIQRGAIPVGDVHGQRQQHEMQMNPQAATQPQSQSQETQEVARVVRPRQQRQPEVRLENFLREADRAEFAKAMNDHLEVLAQNEALCRQGDCFHQYSPHSISPLRQVHFPKRQVGYAQQVPDTIDPRLLLM